MSVDDFLSLVTLVLEVGGVGVILLGAVLACGLAVYRLVNDGPEPAYRAFRHGLGRAILLGLELLVAGDIIGTVAIHPSFESVGVLGLIVLIRTFLSFSLEVELEGQWPWGRARNAEPVTSDKEVRP